MGNISELALAALSAEPSLRKERTPVLTPGRHLPYMGAEGARA